MHGRTMRCTLYPEIKPFDRVIAAIRDFGVIGRIRERAQ
jgi:hypothetical protein